MLLFGFGDIIVFLFFILFDFWGVKVVFDLFIELGVVIFWLV